MGRYNGFVGPSARSQSLTACAEELKNFYVVKNPPNGKSPYSLYPTPGVRVIFTVPNSPGKGLFSEAGHMFAVIGTDLVEVHQNFTYTIRSTSALDINGNPVTMCSNGDGGNQLAVSSGGSLYILDLLTHVFTKVANVVADRVEMLNGYFLAFDRGNAKFQISDLFDGLTWDPTQFAQNTLTPDPWRTMKANGYLEAWLLGQYTTQVWVNTGDFPFPFAPREGLVIPFGIGAAFSALSSESVMSWISEAPSGSGVVVEATGYSPQRISNDELEHAMSTYPRIDDAEIWNHQEGGREFLILSFPTADKTWAYDRRLGPDLGWAQRTTFDPTTGLEHRWRPSWHAKEWNIHIVLDSQTGSVYQLSSNYGLDVDGLPIRRVRSGPSLSQGNKRMFYPEFELLIESGLGETSGQGFDPQVLMEISNDGGRSWTNGRARSAGKTGEFGKHLIWNGCGSAYDRAFRVIFTDPTPLRIIDAFVRAKPGISARKQGQAA